MRLQILELPSKARGDDAETPFVIVVSEVAPFSSLEHMENARAEYRDLKENTGAAGIFIVHEPVEIGPAPERLQDRDLTPVEMTDLVGRYR